MSNTASSGRGEKNKSKIRTFIAVNLPEHVIRSLDGLQRDLKKCGLRIKWSRPENIHLTLKFLGDILPADVDPIRQSVGDSVKGFVPIELCVSGLGFFPGIRRARVLWTGISGQTDQLEKLHHAIDDGLGSLGFAREERRFKGHLTLGRFKGSADPDPLIEMMKTHRGMASESFFVDAVSLYKSDLKPTGPIYSELAKIRLDV